jgi:hypothetical protein
MERRRGERAGWGYILLGVVAVAVGFGLPHIADGVRIGFATLACIFIIGPGLVILGIVMVIRNRNRNRNGDA